MVLQCKCSFGMVTFPVTVTQQSPAAVSMDTYQVSIEAMQAQVETTNEAKLFSGLCLHVYCCGPIIRLPDS
ncbi:phospholipid transfer protein C2CD2L [Tachysurus ichikawai]